MYELLTGILLTLLLLSIQHFGLWEIKMPLVLRYTLGTAALGAGATLALGMIGDWWAVGVVWLVAGAGGALIAPLHLWRHYRGQKPADVEDAFQAGALVRRANGGTLNGTPRERDDRRA